MKRIRGPSGIGDAVYLRCVVEYFVRMGETVVVCSDHPEVFIGSGAVVEPFRRDRVDAVATYAGRKQYPETNQFQDMCIAAGIGADVPMRFGWTVRNTAMVAGLLAEAGERPVILIHGGRAPMARVDRFGAELMPREVAFGAVLGELNGCFTVQVGKASQIYPLKANVDMNGGTSVSDLLDIASICAGWVAQVSFAVPMAECFDKPILCVWSADGLASREPYVRQITPAKILSKPTSRYVVDDWPEEKLREEARAFRALV